jgi:DNA-directed RNA polymerase II subunit RPB2
MLFNNAYKTWIKAFTLAIDKEYNYNKKVLYKDENFRNIFQAGNDTIIFAPGLLSDIIMRGFKGKWGSGMGEEKTGVLQALSRLSYVDFMSHCRRVILDFDTSMKLTGPRKLHTSQYGYFCTSETPTGGSIGITKNLSIMTAISTSSQTDGIKQWLKTVGRVYSAEDVTEEQRSIFVPFYLNGGMFGYTAKPYLLTDVLKAFKRAGCLPYSVSITFSIRDRCVYLYMDEGRPLRPLIWLDHSKSDPIQINKIQTYPTWRDLVMGNLAVRKQANLDTTTFFDPLAEKNMRLEDYLEALMPHTGCIEYIDPYEQNEIYIANNPFYINKETTHIEVHPSTIMSMMTSLIPFAQHNQSPRNQLSCSQSKQGVSVYATNWRNRFDNMAHVLCYGEMPITRTLYNNYLGEGKMAYGMNCVLAIACWSGYNQEDGIVMNYDAVQRGMFRSMAFRSYEAFEEDDPITKARTRFGNPLHIATWKDLQPGCDYSKLDEQGIIREGEYVDENTIIVGAYLQAPHSSSLTDVSVTPQVWTRGRVEKVVVMVNNMGMRLVKIRVVQDRMPELGDKFSNRHGQKGTIGALLRGHDMPRTASGIVPDMIMNPHAIPSRMTIAQNLEQLLGKTAAMSGAIGDGTAFMNDGSPQEAIGALLEQHGFEKYGNEIMYNGATGEQINAAIFIGPVYGMRLKHMVEDKWQARGQGRREQRTHQPTGGRGNQGGLKIGEMDRDAILGHGVMGFFKESFMERSDGSTIALCTSCGTIPIYNPRLNIRICSMCDGPVKYLGDTEKNLEILPPMGRPKSNIVEVQVPYSTKLLTQELETYLNLEMRYITTHGFEKLREFEFSQVSNEAVKELPRLLLPEISAPVYIEEKPKQMVSVEQLQAMGASIAQLSSEERQELDTVLEETPEGVMFEQSMNMGVAPSGESIINQGVSLVQQTVNPVVNTIEGAITNGIEAVQSLVQGNEGQQEGGRLPPNDPMIVSGNPMNIQRYGQINEGIMGNQNMNENDIYMNAPLPNGIGGTIVVDTSPQAMIEDGLGMGVMSRPIRRSSYANMNGSRMGGMMPRTQMMPSMPGTREMTMPSHSSHNIVTINKLDS